MAGLAAAATAEKVASADIGASRTPPRVVAEAVEAAATSAAVAVAAALPWTNLDMHGRVAEVAEDRHTSNAARLNFGFGEAGGTRPAAASSSLVGNE